MPKLTTMRDAMRANRQAGSFFFAPDTMRFWESVVYHDTWQASTGLFITSETLVHDERVYCVRKLDLRNAKHIYTLGRYDTMEEARHALHLHHIHNPVHGRSGVHCDGCEVELTRAEKTYNAETHNTVCGACLLKHV